MTQQTVTAQQALEHLFGPGFVKKEGSQLIITLSRFDQKELFGDAGEINDDILRDKKAQAEKVFHILNKNLSQKIQRRLNDKIECAIDDRLGSVSFEIKLFESAFDNRVINALLHIKPEEIDPDNLLALSERFKKIDPATERAEEIRERFNFYLSPIKWRVIDTENGRAITTMGSVTNPGVVMKALGLLFDVGVRIPSEPGPVVFPLEHLKNTSLPVISDKLRGLNETLAPELRPFSASRAAPLRR